MGGKWIRRLSPELPVAEAARVALTSRLANLVRLVRPAVEKGYAEMEHVHALRIATRRASAALRAFAEFLPARPLKAAKRLLRRIRRASGEARDWDVLLCALPQVEALQADASRPALDFLLGHASGRRAAAQPALAEAGAEFARRFPKQARILLNRIRTPQGKVEPSKQFAERHLLPLLAEFTAAVQENSSDPDEMHARRILAKRLRYALEIFIDCFPRHFRTRVYPAIEAAQDILGAAHDAAVGGMRLEGIREQLAAALPADAARIDPPLERFAAELHTQAAAGPRRFAAWRKEWLKLTGKIAELESDTAEK